MKYGGFTLLEISFALLIAGILGTAVFKGGHIMEDANFNRLMGKISAYKQATQKFIHVYGSLPGDYLHASDHISPTLKNGNGNGVVEGGSFDAQSEAFWFWQHLAEDDLIPHPGHIGRYAPAFGHGVPASAVGGGFTVEHNTFGLNQHWLVVGRRSGNRGNGALLTPKQMSKLLRLLKVVGPLSHGIRVKDGAKVPKGSCMTGEQLNLKTRFPACVLYVHLWGAG